MRNVFVVLAVAGALCLAQGQATLRWQRLYGVSGYETLFNAMQYDGAETLYLLATLRQPEGEDGVSLARYTLRGALLDARPHGLSNGAQEEGFGLHLLHDGACIVVCALSEPIEQISDRTTLVYYPAVGNPTMERRAYGLPAALAAGDNQLFVATRAPNGRATYLIIDSVMFTYREIGISSDAVVLDAAWEALGGVALGGWTGTEIGRTGFYWRNNAFTYRNEPFSYTSQVQPLPNGTVVTLWGSGDQNEAWMYGPDGLQAERLSLQSATSSSGEIFLYVLAQGAGGHILVRLDDATLTRQWELPLDDFSVGHWAVDSAGHVYLLGDVYGSMELRKIRPDGSLVWQMPAPRSMPPPYLKRMLPLSDGRVLLAGDAPMAGGEWGVMVALIGRLGDTNGDGCVDDADLLRVLTAFGSDAFAADLNADGIVDDADLLEVLFAFGTGC